MEPSIKVQVRTKKKDLAPLTQTRMVFHPKQDLSFRNSLYSPIDLSFCTTPESDSRPEAVVHPALSSTFHDLPMVRLSGYQQSFSPKK